MTTRTGSWVAALLIATCVAVVGLGNTAAHACDLYDMNSGACLDPPTTKPKPRPAPATTLAPTTTLAVGDQDADGDGVKNSLDTCPATPAGEVVDTAGCAVSQTDTDNDGLTPAQGDPDDTDPCAPDMTADTCDQDADGLTNLQERSAGTDPTNADTDSDGVLDGNDNDNTTPPGATVDAFGVQITTATDTPATTLADTGNNNSSSTGLIAALATGGAALAGLLLFAFKRRKKEPNP